MALSPSAVKLNGPSDGALQKENVHFQRYEKWKRRKKGPSCIGLLYWANHGSSKELFPIMPVDVWTLVDAAYNVANARKAITFHGRTSCPTRGGT